MPKGKSTKGTAKGRELAWQQLWGYHHAQQGYGIIGLIEGMNIEKEEWDILRDQVKWLAERDEIDAHFYPGYEVPA